MFRVPRLRDFGCAAALSSVLCCKACAQPVVRDIVSASSFSGQFVATGTPRISALAIVPAVATNANFVRLEPALLAVSAERLKESLWQELGINGPWHGKIFLALHPARSLNEDVTIVSARFAGGWNYRVALPDVLPRTRFLRAMVSVLLLEFANRNADARAAEIPAWLTDGLAQQLLAPGAEENILSLPNRIVNGVPLNPSVTTQRGVDLLAGARRVLRDQPALTFQQLSWPGDTQLSGDDGGVYRASAQLFVSELLDLKNGPAHLRAMLQALPRYYNWQTAFQTAFRADFRRLLDVEKWWALRVVGFVSREPGPTWTAAVSREKLDEILRVPVDFRTASNALPARAEISLQAVIRNWDYARQAPILQTKLRNLELAQLRLALPFAVLTSEYRRVLAAYLSQRNGVAPPSSPWNRHPTVPPLKTLVRETLKQLDALDARRHAAEAATPNLVIPPGTAPKNPRR
jgi:hypothetical protein